MDNIKNIIAGGAITLLVGGGAYTFSQQDLVDNFAEDSGLTQEQAEQYINNIPEDELGTWNEIGSLLLETSKETLVYANDVDCVNYEYEWESSSITCYNGKAHLQKMGTAEQTLGYAFMELDSDSATETDMNITINYIDQLNSLYDNRITRSMILDQAVVDEMIMTNSYNKSLLTAALESE